MGTHSAPCRAVSSDTNQDSGEANRFRRTGGRLPIGPQDNIQPQNGLATELDPWLAESVRAGCDLHGGLIWQKAQEQRVLE
jgi:hypothetical protein